MAETHPNFLTPRPAWVKVPGVFREIKKVRQEPGPGSRRWFESDGMDLVVWLDAQGVVNGFQLVFDLG